MLAICLLLRNGSWHFQHSTITKASLMEYLWDGCLSGRFLLQNQYCYNGHWVLGNLLVQGPSNLFTEFGQMISSRKSRGAFKLFPISRWWSPPCSWECSLLQKWFYTLSQIYVSTQFDRGCLGRVPWIWVWHTMWIVGTHTLTCAILNHVQCIEFATGRLQSRSRGISR